jgi:hypothetical protein
VEEPFVVRRRSRRWPWFPVAWGSLIGLAMIIAAAVVIADVAGRVVLVISGAVLLTSSAELAARLRAGDVVFEITDDGIWVASIGLFPWGDVRAIHIQTSGGLHLGLDVSRESSAWRELPRWRRAFARLQTLARSPAFSWQLGRLDQRLEAILAAIQAAPAAGRVSVRVPTKLLAT